MTPQQRALQLEGGAAAGAPLMLDAGRGAGGPQSAAVAARTAAAVDAFNATTRKKSLVEAHSDRMAEKAAEGKKARKKHKGAGGKAGAAQQQQQHAAAAGDEGWDPTQHPWRPFDREKDLGPGLGSAKVDAAKMIENAKALSSRFGSGGATRSFL